MTGYHGSEIFGHYRTEFDIFIHIYLTKSASFSKLCHHIQIQGTTLKGAIFCELGHVDSCGTPDNQAVTAMTAVKCDRVKVRTVCL
jgi:hypothetical protein